MTVPPHTTFLSRPAWPTSLNSLAWSSSSSLAIALDTSIDILSPRLSLPFLASPKSALHRPPNDLPKIFSRAHSGNTNILGTPQELENWQRVKLNASVFTLREWPWVKRQDFDDFDVGEELGESPVVSIEWSGNGLASAGGQALGVLTGNGLLSIWADEEGSGAKGWTRLLVVNRALRIYFGVDDEGVDSDGGDAQGDEMERVKINESGSTAADIRTDGANGHIKNGTTRDGMAGVTTTRIHDETNHDANGVTTTNAPDTKRTKKERCQRAREDEASFARRCRVRSYTWTSCPEHSPALPPELQAQAEQDCRIHLLLVANDNDEVIALQVRSPYNNLLDRTEWQVAVLYVVSISEAEPQTAGLFTITRGIHKIAASPWSRSPGSDYYVSLLACARNDDLKIMRCSLSSASGRLDVIIDTEHALKHAGRDIIGPLHWLDKVCDSELQQEIPLMEHRQDPMVQRSYSCFLVAVHV
jgi:hypothetical protein